MLWLPLAALVPVQPPEAVHAVALVELHVSMDEPPLVTAEGFAVIVANGPTLTVTVERALAPPAPVQVIEYAVGTVSAPVLCEPLVALVPLQPPEAVHEVALVEDQVSAVVPPEATDVGEADNVTT